MTSPRRGEQQAAPAEHGIIHSPFCQQSSFVCAVSKVSVTLAGHTHTFPQTLPLPVGLGSKLRNFNCIAKKGRSVETPVSWESL